MPYPWEEQALKDYDQETVDRLVQQQKDYEEERKDNDCPSCGWKNQSAVVKLISGYPILLHFGLWQNGYCETCHQPQQ